MQLHNTFRTYATCNYITHLGLMQHAIKRLWSNSIITFLILVIDQELLTL